MILLCKLAAAVFVAAVLTLLLKKDQPAFAFLVSACTAAGLLAVVVQQVGPVSYTHLAFCSSAAARSTPMRTS